MIIREATEQELTDVFTLTVKGVEELDSNPHDVKHHILADNIIKSHLEIPALVVEIDGKIVGCASLTYTSTAWSDEKILTTIMVYVLPRYRSFAIIKELYKKITQIADLQGIPYIDSFHGTDKFDARARLSQACNLKVIGINVMAE